MPTDTVTRADRIQWYWKGLTFTVIASYITEDSVATEDVVMHRHGARKGDFTIDILGFNAGGMRNYPVSEAKVVADYVLSAIGWEHVWRQHYQHPGYTTEGGEMAHIPHSDPGPAVKFAPSEAYEELKGDGAMVRDYIPSPESQRIAERRGRIGKPVMTGKTEVPLPNEGGGWSVPEPPTEFVGDNPYDPAAQREHRCCGHCDQSNDTHAPHTMGCPSGFDLPDEDDDDWRLRKIQ
jgi:hypothetical protein